MLYKTLLIIVTLLLTVLGVNALAHSQGDLPIIALAIPALWLLPQGGVAAWLLLLGLGVVCQFIYDVTDFDDLYIA